jgi:hypothetical protein
LLEPFARIPKASLLRQAAYGTARVLCHWITAMPPRVYVGAVLSAVAVGVGGNVLLVQKGRQSAPLFVPPDQHALTASPPTASPITTAVPDTRLAPPTTASASNQTLAATPPVAKVSHASPMPASSLPPPSVGPGERRSGARSPDQIGALLRGELLVDESRSIRTAQSGAGQPRPSGQSQ